jgi:DNA-binding MurR/RpiR family transcriptional regulator
MIQFTYNNKKWRINMSIDKLIKSKYKNLSNKQKTIADYMFQNEAEISFKSLKEISDEIGVTEVTIINFCKSIGLNSFSDLKQKYQDLIVKKVSPTQKLFENINKETMKNDLFVKIIDLQLKNHQITMSNLKEDELEEAVELINKAKKVYIYGEGLSVFISNYFKNRLENLGIEVEVVDLSNLNTYLFIKTLKFSKDDLYIAITYPKYSKIVLKFSEYLKNKGYNIIGLTDKKTSPLKENIDITFYSENDSLIFYNSIHSAISIIEIITTILYKYSSEKLKPVRNEVEQLEEEFKDFISE